MRVLGHFRRFGVLTATVMAVAGASALVACSGSGGGLDWTAFGLETSVPDGGTSSPDGTTDSTGGPDDTSSIVTTTEPAYSGEGAWLFITSSEIDPGASFSLQVVGFAPNSDVTIELRTSVATTVLDTLTTDDEGQQIEGYVLPTSTPEGDHRIMALGTDADGVEVEVGQRLTVDLSKPVITGLSASPSVVAVGNTVSVYVDVTDTYGVETVSITTRAQNGSDAPWCADDARLVSGSDENGRWRVNCTVPSTAPKTGYLVSATAVDYSGNSVGKASSSAVFNTSNGADVTAPTIGSVTVSTSSASAGDTITINVRASDVSGINQVKVTVRTPNDTPAAWCDKFASLYSGRAQDGTWRVTCTVAVGASGGTYNVQVVADDTAGNYSPSGVTRATFDVSGNSDVLGPSISSATASPSSVSAGGSFTVSIDMTDATGVANVYLSVVGGVDVTCGAATLSSGSSTSGTWTATCSVGGLVVAGSYSIDVIADDLAGNYSSTSSVSFSVV